MYIYIYCDIPAAHDGAQGLSLQCPATAPTEGVAVQGHCMQVRLHGSRGGVFVGHRPPRDPGGPLQIIEVLHLFRWYTHTHHLSHHFVTDHLSHTTLSRTIFDTPSFTHDFVTHHLSHTIFHTPSFTTPSFTHHLSPHHL